MRLIEKLKYETRRYLYQIEQQAYHNKNQQDKESKQFQKTYEKSQKSYGGSTYSSYTENEFEHSKSMPKKRLAQESYYKESYTDACSNKKVNQYQNNHQNDYHYVDSNQDEYYDVYTNNYTSPSKKEYYNEGDKKPKASGKLNELENYLEEALSGIKKSKK